MADEVIFHAPTKHTLDPRMIEQSIIIAEERFISAALGFDYYEALLNSKNLVITDSNKSAQQTLINNSLPAGSAIVTLNAGDIINAAEYLPADDLALWNRLLWKLTAECVLLTAYPEGFVQFSTSGTIHDAPPAGPMTTGGVVTADMRSVRWVMDKKLSDRIGPLRENMHTWLCKQKKADITKYPLYKHHCDCNADGVAIKRKTDIILGIYDEQDEKIDHHRHHRRQGPPWHQFDDWDD